MKRICMICILVLILGLLSASEYERLKAAEARGIHNPDLFYNLGVTYWQTGHSGMATLYFLKALNLNSAHKLSRENLDYIIKLSQDRELYPQRLFLLRIFSEVYYFLNLNRIAILSLALLLVFALSLLWYINYDPDKERALPGLTMSLVFALLLCSVFLTGFKLYRQSRNRQAVLIENTAELKDSPGSQAKRVAKVHEGIIMEIRKSSGDWLQVSLPNAESGWIEESAVARVRDY